MCFIGSFCGHDLSVPAFKCLKKVTNKINKHLIIFYFLEAMYLVVVIANSVPTWLFWGTQKKQAYEDITTINGVNLEMWDLFQM